MSPLASVLNLIIHIAFDGYIVILLLRLILQKLHASWHNPLSKFIIKLTEKPLKPLRKIAPGIKGFDTSILLLALVLQFIEVIILWYLQIAVIPNFLGSFFICLSEIIAKFIYIYIYAIIINAVSTWLPQMERHPITHIIYLIVEPILSPIRRYIPLIAGIDFSPVFALLALTIMNMLVVAWLLEIGTRIILR
ncbi:MAG: YggT family protein [Gammaproteobacteria bacterium]|nr:YggT family protein [Gammaproteobacteria bacterium]